MNSKTRWFGLGLGALVLTASTAIVSAGDETKDHKHKDGSAHKDTKAAAAATIGQPAPDFTLTDTDGKSHKLSDLKGQIVVLEWFNPGCPVVKTHYTANTMKDTMESFKGQKVTWLAINSGAAGKEGAGLEANKTAKADWKMAYPVLLDESGTVGKAFGAKTTPHMFVIDAKGALVYAGAIDDGSPSAPGKTNYVKQAVGELLKGETVSTSSTKPYGCSVKYGS